MITSGVAKTCSTLQLKSSICTFNGKMLLWKECFANKGMKIGVNEVIDPLQESNHSFQYHWPTVSHS